MQGWCGDQYYKCRVPIDSTDWSLAQAKVRETEAAVILPQPLPEPILGNTPLIVQKHYAPFVQARQLILEKQVMATW